MVVNSDKQILHFDPSLKFWKFWSVKVYLFIYRQIVFLDILLTPCHKNICPNIFIIDFIEMIKLLITANKDFQLESFPIIIKQDLLPSVSTLNPPLILSLVTACSQWFSCICASIWLTHFL